MSDVVHAPEQVVAQMDGYDHNAPPEVIAPILAGFFGAQVNG